jgi:hypothetical protein
MTELHDVKLVGPSTIGITHYLAASVATIRDLLRRILSPRLFQFVRFRWWCLSFYFPRLVTSWFVKNTPEGRGFDGSQKQSELPSASSVAWLDCMASA